MTDGLVKSFGFSYTGKHGFDPSDSFLSDQRYVYEKKIRLVGRVRSNGQLNEFNYGLVLSCAYDGSPADLVDEIRFQ